MHTNLITRFFGGVFKLLLTLITLLAAQMLLLTALIRMMRHDKRLRVKVFKLFNSVTFPLAGRRFSPYGLLKHTGRRSNQSYVTHIWPVENTRSCLSIRRWVRADIDVRS
jgi:hypothetical protein